ncbi:MAG: hypothetical protein GY771_16665 [bacterium]|nr:hypothetical protein [bacterium]
MKRVSIVVLLVLLIALAAGASSWKEFIKSHGYGAFLNVGMTRINTSGFNEVLRENDLPELRNEQMTVGLSGYVIFNRMLAGLSADVFFNEEMLTGDDNRFFAGDLTLDIGWLAYNTAVFRGYPYIGLGGAGYALNHRPQPTTTPDTNESGGIRTTSAGGIDIDDYLAGDWEGAGGFVAKAGIGLEAALPISAKFNPALGIRAGYMWPAFKESIQYTDEGGLEQTGEGPQLRGFFISLNLGLTGF